MPDPTTPAPVTTPAGQSVPPPTVTTTPPAGTTPPNSNPGQTPPAGKAEGAPGGNATPETGKPDGQTVVPEKYDLKVPDGSLLSASATDEIATFAKENNLTNAAAQKLLEQRSAWQQAHVEGQKKQLDEQTKTWLSESEKDKEFGGEGFKQNAELAKRVVTRFASDALRKQLDETGLGNYPEFVRFVVRIGRSMAEDQLVIPGTGQGTGKREHHEILYPQTNKET